MDLAPKGKVGIVAASSKGMGKASCGPPGACGLSLRSVFVVF